MLDEDLGFSPQTPGFSRNTSQKGRKNFLVGIAPSQVSKMSSGAPKIKTMEASSDGTIAERNHQFLEPLDAFGHVSHGRARSYT